MDDNTEVEAGFLSAARHGDVDTVKSILQQHSASPLIVNCIGNYYYPGTIYVAKYYYYLL